MSGQDKFDFHTVPSDVITKPTYVANGTGNLKDDITEAISSGGFESGSVVYILEINGIGEGNYLFYDENGDDSVGINETVIHLGDQSDSVLYVSDFI